MSVQTIIKRLIDGKIKTAEQLETETEDLDLEERQQMRIAIAVLSIANKAMKRDMEKEQCQQSTES